ncbi:GNAT family N-acetyltransferase [Paenibacillus aestuarii]|uniref:GNAT family N-acetyltransferase n=1 Tax=Paenibacillus aestuarii TaxID=516965 RepID=A0ABW0KA94_9BACL|nr:GNAT family N-acetyltransferase [Paenibacillus aestuarii]
MRRIPVSYRSVTDVKEIEEIIELQHMIWGAGVVPLGQLIAAAHNGGVVIGAFLHEKLIGFCYGFPGYRSGENYLYSHMLGIHPDYRDLGMGHQLKFEQRTMALALGYDKMLWTYDPLESRNAYLNLCKLGAYVKTYVESYYGEMNDQINRGLPSDRCIVEWKLNSNRAIAATQGAALEEERWKAYDRLIDWQVCGVNPSPISLKSAGEKSGYLIPVPTSIQNIKQLDMALASEWRFAIRKQFRDVFLKGFAAVGLIRSDEPVQYYVIEKAAMLS